MNKTAFYFSVTAILLGSAAASALDVAGAVAPNLPGMRYCPAPDCDNSAFLDTYYSIDASTGQLTAHTPGTVSAPGVSRVDAGEEVLYAPPGIAARNALAQPRHVSSSLYADDQPLAAEAGEIPWWKGGLWRNNDDGGGSDGDNAPSADDAEVNNPSAPRVSGSWDDGGGEYTGYNADGSFGRPTPPRQDFNPPPQPAAAPAYGYSPAPAPAYGAPPAAGYGEPVQQPYAASPYGVAPAAYPPQQYAAPAPGPAYQAAPVDTSMYGGGAVYNDAGYGAPPPSPGYTPPPAPIGYGQSYQGEPSIDAQGSPQFENAVRLVKENRFTEAKSILASETTRNPANASAWRWLADCHYNLLELDDAINCYQRALERAPNDFYALRGQGFSYLHRGHEYWRQMQEQVAGGNTTGAAATFAVAHDNYKKSLELLGLCLRRVPDDGEAIYGEAMAAEGASRKLYSNALSYLKLGPEQRQRAELFADNCMTVINKGVDRARERARQNPGEAGPRALLGGLYMRKAFLYHHLNRDDMALSELRNARDVNQSILDEIDKNNAAAQRNLRECEMYWQQWGGSQQQG